MASPPSALIGSKENQWHPKCTGPLSSINSRRQPAGLRRVNSVGKYAVRSISPPSPFSAWHCAYSGTMAEIVREFPGVMITRYPAVLPAVTD